MYCRNSTPIIPNVTTGLIKYCQKIKNTCVYLSVYYNSIKQCIVINNGGCNYNLVGMVVEVTRKDKALYFVNAPSDGAVALKSLPNELKYIAHIAFDGGLRERREYTQHNAPLYYVVEMKIAHISFIYIYILATLFLSPYRSNVVSQKISMRGPSSRVYLLFSHGIQFTIDPKFDQTHKQYNI